MTVELKYAKVLNEQIKTVSVFEGTDIEWAISQGFTEQEVEQAYNGSWYLLGYAPTKPPETTAEKLTRLEREYQMNRWQREMILAENSGASEYSKTKAQELEDLAEELRNSI